MPCDLGFRVAVLGIRTRDLRITSALWAVADGMEALLLAVARGQEVGLLPAAARRLNRRSGVAYVRVSSVAPFTAALTRLPAR
ncbi:hypothetical protein SAMN05216259_11977 [Actinacidiphila guanduensis]|uniref:Uncharacterized protein n=1 Tax=Actinacidiphila guanduensis TaxID=310781 RepID=A0A1H0QPS9_9ACTN|nr:hypothetical protein SAMN05216259_11977 [Actinacidiphila guanduensis]